MRGKSAIAEAEIIIGQRISSSVLDEESWDAISVVAAGAAHLADPNLVVNGVSHFVTNFPVAVALGAKVYAIVWCDNDSSFDQYLKVTLEFIDPDGDSRGLTPTTRTFSANSASSCYVATPGSPVTIDKPGTWEIHGIIETA